MTTNNEHKNKDLVRSYTYFIYNKVIIIYKEKRES